MIDLEVLKRHGLTDDNLRKWLAIDPLNIPTGDAADPNPDKAAEARRGSLFRRIRSRIQEGMSRNLADYKHWYALDQAWDTPFRQISPTLLQEFIDRDPNDEQVYKAFQDWGMTSLICEGPPDPKTNKPTRRINLPIFFNIFVPLVRSYVTIRWAKIINDRRLTPLFKFEPVDQTAVLNLLCKALTDRVQVMSNQYGYFDVMKQAVLKMLHYSICLMFPRSEWHYEDEWKEADPVDVMLGHKKEDGAPASVGDDIKVTAREGISYHFPHPSRMYYDLAHGPYTLNYDYGCEYAGYWRIARYREVLNSNFWNKDKIALGSVDMVSGNKLFFTTVYSACTLTIPIKQVPQKKPDGPVLGAELGLGSGVTDREREIATLYYGIEHGDQGVLMTEHWERLVPADNGLGTYDCPVWFRFVVAGDGCTILYAAPVPYSPTIYFGYDADESRSKNASLSLEILPFQDHFSNMLTQIILTCKQNLANLTFIDEDQLTTGDPGQRQSGRETIDRIRNLGEGYYRFLNIFGYSSKRALRMQTGTRGIPDVVQSFNFPRGNVAEMSQVLRTILDILERVLVMSSQEIAQAATHELRVDEVRNIQASTSSRLQFSATPVDVACDAWKRQLHSGVMAFGDEDFWVHLPSDVPLTQEQLEKIGFTVHKKELQVESDRFIHARIKKKHLTALPLWAIASTRDVNDRIDNVKMAQAMALFIDSLLRNPMTAQALGPDQAMEWANQIAKMMGFSRELKLRNVAPQASQEQQQAEAQQQLKGVIDAVLKVVDGKLKQDLTPLMDATKTNAQEISLLFKALHIPLVHPNDTAQAQTNGPAAAAPNPRMAAPPVSPALPPTPA